MAVNAVIGALRVNLGMDSAQFHDGMKGVSKGLDGIAKKVAAFGAAVGVAMAGAATAMGYAVSNVINSADKLGDVADRLGVSIEALQELRHAAERGGMGVQNFDVALRRFIRRASEAAQGTGAAKGAFEELGISLRDSEGRLKASEVLLGEVADAMQKVPNQADRLRLAFKMFDTDGAAMVNVLAGGSAGLNRMREEARNLGLVLSDDAVRGAQAFKDNIDLIGKAKDGLITKLTAQLLPALEVLSEKFLGFVNDEAAVTAAADGIGKAFQWVARQAAHVAILIDRLRAEFVGLKESISLALSGDFAGARAAWSAGQEASARMRDELNATLEQMESGFINSQGSIQRRISAAFGDAGREAGENFAAGIESSTGGGGRVKSAFDAMAAEAARIFEQTRTPLEQYQAQIARLNELLAAGAINQDTYNRAVIQAQDAFQQSEDAANKAGNTFQQVGQMLASSFSTAFSSIIDGSKRVTDVIADVLKQLGNLLVNKAFQALFGGLFGGGGFSVPGFANGTPFHMGGLAMVGERGPELVNLPRGAQVIPNRALREGGGSSIIQVQLSPDLEARVLRQAADQSVSVTQAGIQQYDRHQAPLTAQRAVRDPRLRG